MAVSQRESAAVVPDPLQEYPLSSRYLFASRLMKIQKGDAEDDDGLIFVYENQKMELVSEAVVDPGRLAGHHDAEE